MAEDSVPTGSFVLGCTFLFVAVLGTVVLVLPFLATLLAYSRWIAAECDQPLVMWVLGFVSAFGYLTLFACFHQLTGRPEKDGCVMPAVLCKGSVIVFVIVWAVLGTLWHRSAEECSQELTELVRWALLYLYAGIPAILLTYWLLVCFGTAALMGPLAASAAAADPAAGAVVPRPALRRGTTREILRRSFAQPEKAVAEGSGVPCSHCGKRLKRSEMEAAEELDGPCLCSMCLLSEEQRIVQEERHTQIIGQLEEQHRWHLGAQATVTEYNEQVVADIQGLQQATVLPRGMAAELSLRVDGLATQLRRQGAKQVATLLQVIPGAAELRLQDAFTSWRLLVRRVGRAAVADLLARRRRRLEHGRAEEQLLRLFLAWCNETRRAGRLPEPLTYRCLCAGEKQDAYTAPVAAFQLAAPDGAAAADNSEATCAGDSADGEDPAKGSADLVEANSAFRESQPSFVFAEVDGSASSSSGEGSHGLDWGARALQFAAPAAAAAGPVWEASSAERADAAASEDQAVPAAAIAGRTLEAGSAEAEGAASEDRAAPAVAIAERSLGAGSAEAEGAASEDSAVPTGSADAEVAASTDRAAPATAAGGPIPEVSSAEAALLAAWREEAAPAAAVARGAGVAASWGRAAPAAAAAGPSAPEARPWDRPGPPLAANDLDEEDSTSESESFVSAVADQAAFSPERAGGDVHSQDCLEEVTAEREVNEMEVDDLPSQTVEIEVREMEVDDLPSETVQIEVHEMQVDDLPSQTVEIEANEMEANDLPSQTAPSAPRVRSGDAVDVPPVHDGPSTEVDLIPLHSPDEPPRATMETTLLHPSVSAVDGRQEPPHEVQELRPPESLGPSQPDLRQPAEGSHDLEPPAPSQPLVPAAPARLTPAAPRSPIVPGPPPRGGPSRRRGPGPAAFAASAAARGGGAASGCKQPVVEAEAAPPDTVKTAESSGLEHLGERDGQPEEHLGTAVEALHSEQKVKSQEQLVAEADGDEVPGSDSTAAPVVDSPEGSAARAQRLGVLAMASLAGRAFMDSVEVVEEASDRAASVGQTAEGDAGMEGAVGGDASEGEESRRTQKVPSGVLAMASLAGEALAGAASLEPRTAANVMWVRITDSPEVSSPEDSDMEDDSFQLDASGFVNEHPGGHDGLRGAPAGDGLDADAFTEVAPSAEAFAEAAPAANLFAEVAGGGPQEATLTADAFAEVARGGFQEAARAEEAEAFAEAAPPADAFAEVVPVADAFAEAHQAAPAFVELSHAADAFTEAVLAADAFAAPAADAVVEVAGGGCQGPAEVLSSGAVAVDTDLTSTTSSAGSAAKPADCHYGVATEEGDHPDDLSMNSAPKELPGKRLDAVPMASLAGRAFTELSGSAKDFAGVGADPVNDSGCAGGLAKPADRASDACTPGLETRAEPAAMELTPPTAVPDVIDGDGVDIMVMDIDSESSSTSDESD